LDGGAVFFACACFQTTMRTMARGHDPQREVKTAVQV
jgi:hypothetical protein